MKNTKLKVNKNLKPKNCSSERILTQVDGQKTNRGFTLIELLVSIAVFSVVVSINTNMFLNAISGERKAISTQNVSDSARYAMEIISREIRMGSSFVLNSPSDISFVSNSENRIGKVLRFVLNGGQIKFDDDFNGNFGSTANARSITSIQNTNVISLKFDINNPSKQPKITILMNVESKNTPQSTRDEIHLQTTISPRKLNL